MGVAHSTGIVIPFMVEEAGMEAQGKPQRYNFLKILVRQPFRQEKGIEKSSRQ